MLLYKIIIRRYHGIYSRRINHIRINCLIYAPCYTILRIAYNLIVLIIIILYSYQILFLIHIINNPNIITHLEILCFILHTITIRHISLQSTHNFVHTPLRNTLWLIYKIILRITIRWCCIALKHWRCTHDTHVLSRTLNQSINR